MSYGVPIKNVQSEQINDNYLTILQLENFSHMALKPTVTNLDRLFRPVVFNLWVVTQNRVAMLTGVDCQGSH